MSESNRLWQILDDAILESRLRRCDSWDEQTLPSTFLEAAHCRLERQATNLGEKFRSESLRSEIERAFQHKYQAGLDHIMADKLATAIHTEQLRNNAFGNSEDEYTRLYKKIRWENRRSEEERLNYLVTRLSDEWRIDRGHSASVIGEALRTLSEPSDQTEHRRLMSALQDVENMVAQLEPPKLGHYLLVIFLPRRDRISLPGDLTEEYKEYLAMFGKRKAEIWYWKQVVTSVAPIIRAWARRMVKWTLISSGGTVVIHELWRIFMEFLHRLLDRLTK